MATANSSLCNISGSVSENWSWIGCMESDIEQGMEPAHKLIANLAVADFIFGVCGIRIAPMTFLLKFTPKIICIGHISVLTLSAVASTNALIALNVDRYIAISRPLHYYQIVTPRVILLMVVLVWGIAFFNSVITSVGNRWQPDLPCVYEIVSSRISVILSSVLIMTCGAALVSINAYIMMISKHHQQQIHQEPSNSGLENAGATGKSFSAELAKHLKLAKTFGIVVGAFVVCWTPGLTMLLFSVAGIHHETLAVARGVTFILTDCNSCTNFFLYAAKSSQFRAAFRAVLPSRGH
ncbi:PREDICTED: cannabinoid receptor 1-like [Priapulus caudatus]|uniref:Cannabinoid receptor 1-like n=1 Tax=Priapulus caudatus TaxID=37621 RepID=A0ABM1EY33_PRICU|nr:PREDICTED: cannabinoid receptor 1-like [Priapulus caudatus]